MISQPRLVSVNRIWDRSPHNAFTDLIRFRDRWWCTFREAECHGASSGRIRIRAAVVAEAGIDLRDPKLSIMPDGRLLLLTGGSLHENGRYRTRSPRSFWIGTTRPPYRTGRSAAWRPAPTSFACLTVGCGRRRGAAMPRDGRVPCWPR